MKTIKKYWWLLVGAILVLFVVLKGKEVYNKLTVAPQPENPQEIKAEVEKNVEEAKKQIEQVKVEEAKKLEEIKEEKKNEQTKLTEEAKKDRSKVGSKIAKELGVKYQPKKGSK
jgi:cytoskeletal protein RodZ